MYYTVVHLIKIKKLRIFIIEVARIFIIEVAVENHFPGVGRGARACSRKNALKKRQQRIRIRIRMAKFRLVL